jgi:MFS family permease
MNQWSGVNALCYYLAYIFQEYLGYTPSMSLILASVAFTQYAVFSWPPYFYIDKIGRRWSVMGSSAGCAICMAVIAGCLAKNSFSSAAAAVAFMFLYLDCFTLGILPVSWSYSAEIQPLRVRCNSRPLLLGLGGRVRVLCSVDVLLRRRDERTYAGAD